MRAGRILAGKSDSILFVFLALGTLPTVNSLSQPASVAKSLISASSPTVTSGNSVTLTLTAIDAHGNRLTTGGSNVVFSQSGDPDSGSIGTTIDHGNGLYTAQFTGNKAGATARISAKINSASVFTSSPTIHVTGVNLEVPVELIDSGLASSPSARIFPQSRTSLNTNDFDGTIQYYFEIVSSNADTVSRSVSLLNSSGIPVATIAVMPGASALRARVRFSPSVGSDNYRLQLDGTPSVDQLQVFTARILVNQTNATRSKVYFPLLANTYDAVSLSNTINTATDSTFPNKNTSYVQPNPRVYQIFRKNSAHFSLARGQPFTFEAVLATDNPSDTCKASLFNGDIQVRSSEVSVSSATMDLVSASFGSHEDDSSDDEMDFGNGNTFEVRIKSQNGIGDCYIARAGLWIALSSISKGEVYYRLEKGYDRFALSRVGNLSQAALDLSLFNSPNVQVFFETTGSIVPGSALVARVDDSGLNSFGSASPKPVYGCSLGQEDFGNARSWVRTTSNCSGITNGNGFVTEVNVEEGSFTSSGQLAVIQFR